jgi:hypothetical protein
VLIRGCKEAANVDKKLVWHQKGRIKKRGRRERER